MYKIEGAEEFYVEFGDKGFYIDKKEKQFNVYNLTGTLQLKQINFDELESQTEPYYSSKGELYSECGFRYALCGTACGAVALTIASADGPVPLMDVLAAAYMIDCTMGCHDDYCQ